MTIALNKSAISSGKIPVEVPNGDSKLTLFANELGYLEASSIYSIMSDTKDKDGNIVETGDKKTGMAMLVAASITDDKGNKFTIEEVLRLKKEVADPLFTAVLKVNNLDGEAKN